MTKKKSKIGLIAYLENELDAFLDGAFNTLHPNGYCNGSQEFSKLESVITYILIGTWVLITLGESFGFAQGNVFLTSSVALILGFLFGKNKVKK